MFLQLRKDYHAQICRDLLRIRKDLKKGDYPNNADGDSRISTKIAWEIVKQLTDKPVYGSIPEQKTGTIFQIITNDFLQKSFQLLYHLRPGTWTYNINLAISKFDQYKDLAAIQKVVQDHRELATTLGSDYIISPDIVIGRMPVTDEEINANQTLISSDKLVAGFTPLRIINTEVAKPILHASISCKWTLRSDRAQNSRTEALNLIRNRKGNLPHIVAITAEPTTTRIATK